MNHFSMEGTTCWCCGHEAGPGDRASYVRKEVTYRSCVSCWKGLRTRSEEEVRTGRNRDVEGIKALIRGEDYAAEYWTQNRLEQRAMEFRRYDSRFLNELRWKEYADPFAQETHAKVLLKTAEYHKQFNAQRKEERKKAYAEAGGKEQAAARYQADKERRKLAYAEGGGKEVAAQRYQEKKAKAVLELEQRLGVKDE